MTVSSTTNRISYSCNGSQKEFPFNFKIFAKTDLIVILRDSGGNETTLTTGYTVSAGPWPTGGTVTTVTAYAEGNTLVIIRELPQTQGADYVENDPFPAETHEQGLDRSVMLIQEIIEKLGRMLIFAKSSSYSNLSMPDPVASKLLAWKDNLSGIKNVEIQSQGDLSVTAFIKTLLDDEDADAVILTLGITQTISQINHGIDIPSGEIILFEKDTVVTGYTLKIDKDDMVIYITKGSAEGGELGASDKSGGTWTQPNHNHPAGSHVHKWYEENPGANDQTYDSSGNPVNLPAGTTKGSSLVHIEIHSAFTQPIGDGWTSVGSGNTGDGATVNTWRPAGRNFTRQQRN